MRVVLFDREVSEVAHEGQLQRPPRVACIYNMRELITRSILTLCVLLTSPAARGEVKPSFYAVLRQDFDL